MDGDGDESTSAYRERVGSAIYVDSTWRRAVVGGVSALAAASVAYTVADSFPVQAVLVFGLTLVFASGLSAVANRLS